MRRIFKYKLMPKPSTWTQERDGVQLGLRIPRMCRVVHFALQNDVPTVWIEVDDESMPEVRTFTYYGTGSIIGEGHHVGSFFDGPFVWHVYMHMPA